MSDWYYAREDERSGPASEPELRDMLTQGQLTGDSLVWTDGMSDWLPAFEVPAFADFAPETAVCAVSGKRMPVSQMLSYGDQLIDPAQKQAFVQQLGEGSAEKGALPITSGDYTYADPTLRANFTKWLFIGGIFFEMGMVVTDFFDSSMESTDFTIADGVMVLFLLGYFPIWIAGIVFYCMWKHRVCSNAYALGGMEGVSEPITPGWAVGYYFIPVLLLWRPYQAMKQIWDASIGDVKSSSSLGLWWALWILTAIFGHISIRLAFSGQEEASAIIDVITAVIAIPLLIVILKVIREITVAQIAAQKAQSQS